MFLKSTLKIYSNYYQQQKTIRYLELIMEEAKISCIDFIQKIKPPKKTGSKGIPFVDKAVINRIKKLPGRTNTITLYTEFNDGSSIFPLIIDILENCDIHVTVENEKKVCNTRKNAGNNFSKSYTNS